MKLTRIKTYLAPEVALAIEREAAARPTSKSRIVAEIVEAWANNRAARKPIPRAGRKRRAFTLTRQLLTHLKQKSP
jgi:hypothetical protein